MNNLIIYNSTELQNLLHKQLETTAGGKVILVYGSKQIFQFSLLLASHILLQGGRIAVVDGGCRFDLHIISRFARQKHISPEILLNRIFISRGFTPYQMEAVINERLVSFLKKIKSNTAMIFGLLDTFYDEQVRFKEAYNMLKRIIFNLQKMKNQNFSLLVAVEHFNVLPKERNRFLEMLKQTADEVYKLTDENESVSIIVEKNTKTIRSNNYGKNTTYIYRNNRQ
ncbi:MAG: hypothetical protein IGBAC_1474 [Ignavibacteriae bacterium]|nr:MAG: hypothetical protein IGBAC_1474 [Ignavibacteriota bacterium]